jgi:hypothetical protein
MGAALRARVIELATLHGDALDEGKVDTASACLRIGRDLAAGRAPHRDDMSVVTSFIGSRQAQDRYGK